MSELQPLTGQAGKGQEITYMGKPMTSNEDGWHWVMVFPLPDVTKDKSWEGKQCPGMTMDTSKKVAQRIFTKRAWSEPGGQMLSEKFKENMSKQDFHKMVRDCLVDIFTSASCGFTLGTEVTVDKDEIFLLIKLDNLAAQESIANRQEIRMRINEEAYAEKEKKVPLDGGITVPMHLSYSNAEDIKGRFCPFTELELLRMIKARIRDFVKL
jgi:hypothetical protein